MSRIYKTKAKLQKNCIGYEPKKLRNQVAEKGRRVPGGGGSEQWTKSLKIGLFEGEQIGSRLDRGPGRPVPSDSHNNDPWGALWAELRLFFAGGPGGSDPQVALCINMHMYIKKAIPFKGPNKYIHLVSCALCSHLRSKTQQQD